MHIAGECSWWPCRDCYGYWVSRNCCCWSVQPGQPGSGGGPNGRPPPGPPKPRRSPRPRRSPPPPWWPPGRSPKPPGPHKPPASPNPPGSPKPPGPPRSPGPPRPSPRPPGPPRPSPGPGTGNTTGGNRTSPSPRPRSPSPKPGSSSPSPRPKSPRPSPRPPRSPDPDYTGEYDYSPEPDRPSNFTISFASRGQDKCVEPVSPLFRARAFQYAVTKLAGSGFAQDYTILMGGCSCKVDDNQMVRMLACD
jgi:hypothetical protein